MNLEELKKLKLGVGVCTLNRPECLKRIVSYLHKFSMEGPLFYEIFVADDGSEDKEQLEILRYLPRGVGWNSDDRRNVGVARNKNRVLGRFIDYDFVAILEDDCFPIHPNWLSVHVQASIVSDIHHFIFYKHSDGDIHGGPIIRTTRHRILDDKFINIAYRNAAFGIFFFVSKRVIEKIGGFNRDFKTWGYEHVEFSNRICDPRIGLAPPFSGYPSLFECEEYIKWDESVPSVFTEEEKKPLIAYNEKVLRESMSKYDLYRPIFPI